MKTNIILAGVGGQGILTIATIIDTAALEQGLNIKQSEVHGMSQRGGAIQAHIRISNSEIYSDLIPLGKANLILSVEPMELLRYLPYLREDGWLISDSNTFVNIVNYPEKHDLYKQIISHKNHVVLNATSEAKKIGNSKIANIILLGAASHLLPLSEESLLNAIKKFFSEKSERIIDMNLEAFEAGKKLSKGFTEFVY